MEDLILGLSMSRKSKVEKELEEWALKQLQKWKKLNEEREKDLRYIG